MQCSTAPVRRHRLAPIAGLAVFSTLLQPTAAVASIFDNDDRATLGSDDTRLDPVGIVSASKGEPYGTAFLIDDCYALTARHVIHHPEPIGRQVILRFVPWRQSNRLNTTSAIVVMAGGSPTAASDLSQDWVLLRLNRCLGRVLGHFALSSVPVKIQPAEPTITPNLVAVGFSNDRSLARRPTIDTTCRVRLITSFGLLHDCATLPGNSGGPLMAWNKDRGKYEVFAINVAGEPDPIPRPFDLRSANVAVAVQAILPALKALDRDNQRMRRPPAGRDDKIDYGAIKVTVHYSPHHLGRK